MHRHEVGCIELVDRGIKFQHVTPPCAHSGNVGTTAYDACALCAAQQVRQPLQEVEAIRLGLPLPPTAALVEEDLDGTPEDTFLSSSDATTTSPEGALPMLPPPAVETNRGLSPAAVGGIIAAASFVAAVSLGVALWFARAHSSRPPPDGNSSSRRSYLMGGECEKSEEGESVREFVKTALGRATPKRKSSGHVGSTGSAVSSAQSIATSSGHGRSDLQAAALTCSHVHPSHLPHCCSHGLVRHLRP